MNLSEHLSAKKNAGKKLLVPYITGGLEGWGETLKALQEAGADALEVGIPFSDAVMDGPVICEANDQALANGTTPKTILKEFKNLGLEVPAIAMTYYNIAFRTGLSSFAKQLKTSGIEGAILADLPYDSADDWLQASEAEGISPILLAAPTADDKRLKNIAELSRGFIYAVGLLGVTGEREHLAKTATEIAGRLKQITDTPVLIGVGISSPEQAAQACEVADGVIVGSILVRTLMESKSPDAVGSLLGEFRIAIN